MEKLESSSISEENMALFERLTSWFREDLPKVLEWRKQAKEDYAFYSGDQWNCEDLNRLKSQNRPVMTFNRIAPLVNAILGSERQNKRQVRYIPRELGDAKANELLSAIGEWFHEQAEGEYEDSEAFSDAVICGMGWTDTRLDFESNFDGDPVIQRLNPLKMVWDSNAGKANLLDAERLWYVDEKPIEVAKAMFPNVPEHMLHADWAVYGQELAKVEAVKESFYSGKQSTAFELGTRDYVTLVEVRWFERQRFYKVFDPLLNRYQDYEEQDYRQLLAKFPCIKGVPFCKKIVKRAFLGKNLLAPPDQPLVPEGQLGWECITAYYDRIKEEFYGIVRATKDPQRWNNKFFSQVMYLLNSQAKGGILAERGAFESDIQAQESLSRTDQITWLRNGGMGRIQPKPAAQFPSGFFTLFQETKEAITQVTGVSSEFIGIREVNQPGILESQRRQSSLNLLAQLYDSLRRYRKRQGQIILYLIQNHLSDGRLIRILGNESAQYIALSRSEFANKDYDIIIDDAPTSPNEKERSFAIMEAMMPYLRPYLTPEVSLEILKYSSLPSSFVQKLRDIIVPQADKQTQKEEPKPEEILAQKQLIEADMALDLKRRKQEIELQKAMLELEKKRRENENLSQKITNDHMKQQLLFHKLASS